MKSRYKRRYVLGEGYPWAVGFGPFSVFLYVAKDTDAREFLDFPDELRDDLRPKYRLVLELVKETDSE